MFQLSRHLRRKLAAIGSAAFLATLSPMATRAGAPTQVTIGADRTNSLSPLLCGVSGNPAARIVSLGSWSNGVFAFSGNGSALTYFYPSKAQSALGLDTAATQNVASPDGQPASVGDKRFAGRCSISGATDCSGALVTAKGGSAARTLNAVLADAVNILSYGADPTGSTDSTTAFQNALAAVQARQIGSRNYYGPSYPALYVPAGIYKACGVTLPSRYTIVGDGDNATTLIGNGSSCAAVVVFAQNNPSESSQYLNFDHATLWKVKVLGGGAVKGISFPDATYPLSGTGSHYGIAGILRDVSVEGASGDGIYVGTNRNFGMADRVNVELNGGHGWNMNSYDWRMTVGDVGQNTGNGINFGAGGSHDIFGYNIYSNATGVAKSQYVNSYITFTGGSIDDNKKAGLYLSQYSGGSYNDKFTLNGTNIADNSLSGSGSYPQISTNLNKLVLNGVGFFQNIATPSYVVANSGGYVYWNGSTIDTQDGTPYAIAAFQTPCGIVGLYNITTTPTLVSCIPETLSGGLTVTGGLKSDAFTATVSTQYGGITLKNGAGKVVGAIQGTSSTNDTGLLNLGNAGSTIVRLWAGGLSYFQNGIEFGGSAATVYSGEVAIAKINPTNTAPGAGAAKLSVVPGTNSGTCKIIAYAGTSTTPVTIVDNIGGGC